MEQPGLETTRTVTTAVPPQGEAVRARVPRRRVRDFEVTVTDVVAETHDTATLFLEPDGQAPEYRAGQFLTIDPRQLPALGGWVDYLEDAKGRREAPRAYSLASAPDEPALAITIKEERYVRGTTRYPPLLSPVLVRQIPVGTRFTVTGFTGPYVLPPRLEEVTDHLVHVVAGSGSVPNFSILKHALRRHPSVRQTFVYSNKTWEDVIFRPALEELAAAHPGRLRVVHTLTREEDPEVHGPGVRRGRITLPLLAELIPDPRACLVFACGPGIGPWERKAARERGEAPRPRFLETVVTALADLGVPRDRIRRESYG